MNDMTPPDDPLRAMSDADKLRVLATWFDHFDDWREATGKIAPGITDYRDVQNDLRRIADDLEALQQPARSEGYTTVEALTYGFGGGVVRNARGVRGTGAYDSQQPARSEGSPYYDAEGNFIHQDGCSGEEHIGLPCPGDDAAYIRAKGRWPESQVLGYTDARLSHFTPRSALQQPARSEGLDVGAVSVALQRSGALSTIHMSYHDAARCFIAALTDGRDDLGVPDEHQKHAQQPARSDSMQTFLDADPKWTPEEQVRWRENVTLQQPARSEGLDADRLVRAIGDHCHEGPDEGVPLLIRHDHLATFLRDDCGPAIAREYAALRPSVPGED